MTSPDEIVRAAHWLAQNIDTAEHPHTRTLRERFGLEFSDAVKAIAEARRIMRREASHG